MYVYNLTAVVSREVLSEWQLWLKEVYQPGVAATASIEQLFVYKVLSTAGNTTSDTTYALHHQAAMAADLMAFITEVLPPYLQLLAEKFGDKVLLFGTELKLVINE